MLRDSEGGEISFETNSSWRKAPRGSPRSNFQSLPWSLAPLLDDLITTILVFAFALLTRRQQCSGEMRRQLTAMAPRGLNKGHTLRQRKMKVSTWNCCVYQDTSASHTPPYSPHTVNFFRGSIHQIFQRRKDEHTIQVSRMARSRP